MERFAPIRDRAKQREKWRNERRLRVLVEKYRKRSGGNVHHNEKPHCSNGLDSNVVNFALDQAAAGRKAS